MKELEDSPTEKLAKTCNCCHLVAEYWTDRGQECPLLDREGIITPLMLEEGQVKLAWTSHSHIQTSCGLTRGRHILMFSKKTKETKEVPTEAKSQLEQIVNPATHVVPDLTFSYGLCMHVYGTWWARKQKGQGLT